MEEALKALQRATHSARQSGSEYLNFEDSSARQKDGSKRGENHSLHVPWPQRTPHEEKGCTYDLRLPRALRKPRQKENRRKSRLMQQHLNSPTAQD